MVIVIVVVTVVVMVILVAMVIAIVIAMAIAIAIIAVVIVVVIVIFIVIVKVIVAWIQIVVGIGIGLVLGIVLAVVIIFDVYIMKFEKGPQLRSEWANQTSAMALELCVLARRKQRTTKTLCSTTSDASMPIVVWKPWEGLGAKLVQFRWLVELARAACSSWSRACKVYRRRSKPTMAWK